MIKYLNSIYGIVGAVCIIAFIVIYSCFSERGLLQVLSLQSELREIEELNQSIQLENDELDDRVRLLSSDNLDYIGQLAREELGLSEPGEMVYFFEKE
jgi:cell division protein FtsB